MQIHELNSFVGTPGASDYLAIDNGSETFKIGADKLGVSTEMTKAEAETGTSTSPRVITPKVLHDYVEEVASTAEAAAEAAGEAAAELREVLVIDIASFSSLPETVSNANITSDMVVVNSVLGTPSAQTGDWTVTTATGSLTISGTMSGSTTATLYLMKSR